MHFKPHAGLALALLTVGGMTANRPVHAQFFQNSTGLSNPARTITFDEVVLPTNTTVTNQYSLYGLTFTGVTYDPDTKSYNANINGNRIGNFAPFVPATNPFSIHFNSPQNQVAFALSTPTGSSEIAAYLNGNRVADVTVTTNLTSTNNFFGFQGLQLDELRITSLTAFDHTALIDNIQFGAPVPEASSVVSLGLLLLLGVGGLAVSHRRKTHAAR